MPCLRRDEQIEPPRARFPLLKRRFLRRQAMGAPDRDHPRVRLHSDELAPPINKQPAGDARATTDIENHVLVAGEEIIDQRGGITGTGPVVLFSVLAKRSRPVAILVGHKVIMTLEPRIDQRKATPANRSMTT